jgi:hypothetical protein
MKYRLIAFLLFLPAILFSQGNPTRVDSSFGYTVAIPNWLEVKETGSKNTFGGTLPTTKGIENAILISCFSKTEFSSFEAFQAVYLTGNHFGQPTNFSKEHIWYGQNQPVKVEGGVEQKVFLYWHNKIYHNKFVLLQTPKAYLWVQFVATPETYDVNIGKFTDFIKGLKITGI